MVLVVVTRSIPFDLVWLLNPFDPLPDVLFYILGFLLAPWVLFSWTTLSSSSTWVINILASRATRFNLQISLWISSFRPHANLFSRAASLRSLRLAENCSNRRRYFLGGFLLQFHQSRLLIPLISQLESCPQKLSEVRPTTNLCSILFPLIPVQRFSFQTKNCRIQLISLCQSIHHKITFYAM